VATANTVCYVYVHRVSIMFCLEVILTDRTLCIRSTSI